MTEGIEGNHRYTRKATDQNEFDHAKKKYECFKEKMNSTCILTNYSLAAIEYYHITERVQFKTSWSQCES